MRRLLRSLVSHVFALWLTSSIVPTLTITGNLWGMLSAGSALTVMMLLVKPLLTLIFLPINILTLGLLGWMVNVAVLYLWTSLVPNVRLEPWTFPGVAASGFVVPAIHLSYPWTLTVVALVLTTIVHVLSSINED